MTRRWMTMILAVGMVVTLLPAGEARAADEEPEVVVVQHILISFGRKVSGKKIDRNKREAQLLATKLLERARAGEDFGALVDEFTDDRPPGIYKLTNNDVPLQPQSRARSAMVPYFGEVAFGLEVGEIGLAKYRPGMSPYGWHIIKRLE